jgi:hypothetical protein
VSTVLHVCALSFQTAQPHYLMFCTSGKVHCSPAKVLKYQYSASVSNCSTWRLLSGTADRIDCSVLFCQDAGLLHEEGRAKPTAQVKQSVEQHLYAFQHDGPNIPGPAVEIPQARGSRVHYEMLTRSSTVFVLHSTKSRWLQRSPLPKTSFPAANVSREQRDTAGCKGYS